jgi:hypothetical protein
MVSSKDGDDRKPARDGGGFCSRFGNVGGTVRLSSGIGTRSGGGGMTFSS